MTRRFIINFLKVSAFYILLFALCRLIFLLYFARQTMAHGVGSFFLSLYKALPLDFSTAAYLLFIPLLILLIASFWWRRFLYNAILAYLLITAIIYIVLAIAEIGVYQEVHVKLYFNLLTHLQHFDELVKSISLALLATVLSLIVVAVYLSFKLIQKLFPAQSSYNYRVTIAESLKTSLAFAAVVTMLIIACRGGLQPIPINEGEVYFSDNQCVNDATVNPLWSIVHSFIENRRVLQGNAYKTMPDEQANTIVAQLFNVEKDTTVHLFKVAKPNVCIIILESWSADLVESLGGYSGLTPNFEKLVKEGYLFTHIKPSGHVSDQGVPAILSGYPALPIGSAINQPERQVNLPNINNQLSQAGYYSSFFFGGQLIYGNIKTYIFRNKFNRVIDQDELPSSIPAGRIGIHDSIMLALWHNAINTYKQPFLSALFTVSSHSPFDAPGIKTITWGDNYMPYLNGVAYSDKQLGKFFEDIKKERWYDSTIFILVADHSHGTPKEYPYESPEFNRIPLLFCGGALKNKFRGAKNDKTGSQTDVASTLLHQLGYDAGPYHWSKNLMNPYTQQFAFYTFDEGYGFVDSTGVVIWNKRFPTQNRNMGKTEQNKSILAQKGAAMLQVLMNDFLSK